MHSTKNKKGAGSIELEESLGREAAAHRPAFCDALHDRIMEAVRSEPTVQIARTRQRRRGWGILVTAATVLALLGVVAWGVAPQSIPSRAIEAPIVKSSPTSESSQTVFAATTDWKSTDRWIETMALEFEEVQRSSGTLESEWIDQPIATWNHDAKVLADWVFDPLALVARGS